MHKAVIISCLSLFVACAPPAGSGSGGGGGGGGGGGSADAGAGSADAGLECTRSSDCDQGFRCVRNACEEVDQGCGDDRDCMVGERCDNGECVEAGGGNGCQTNADCTGQGQVCDEGACKSGAYGSCQSDADCASGTGCLLQNQDGSRVCGTLCQSSDQCANHESCQQATVCVPNQCDAPNQPCDAHGAGDGLCVSVGQAAICIKGAAAGAGCEPFGASGCPDGKSCQPLTLGAANTYCGNTRQVRPGSRCSNGIAAGSEPFSGDDCAQGNICVATQTDTICVPYCRVGQNSDCPTIDGTTYNCVAVSEIDPQLAGSPWGLCQPSQ